MKFFSLLIIQLEIKTIVLGFEFLNKHFFIDSS